MMIGHLGWEKIYLMRLLYSINFPCIVFLILIKNYACHSLLKFFGSEVPSENVK